MLRVDPNWLICTIADAAEIAASERPGPSCPKSSTQRPGNLKVSMMTEPSTLSIAITGRSASAAHTANSSTVLWCTTCWYRSVTMAPRLFHRLRPTMCTVSAPNALALRTIDPMFMSCCQFSIATWNGLRVVSRSAMIASMVQ